MITDVNIYGVYIPTLAAIALVCFFLNAILRRVLAYIGFYRLVWHRPLFDTAMYFCLLGVITLSINRIPL
ncbi:DUF1656 domain-containing protein [Neorhizobium sp. P12A]|jgi:hypothetical protein|uniref:DUF1656 domain-containing protein n=1 Tax=Rhizobium/Agrobacterium group TaxID=227290 RepID=UPI001047457E|nr:MULTISPECIES: DUF1656 domain-containing protein [Rhizobium/Agrobacterium group]KAA0700856.1 DUF1656 domain-containing protein [Neorhizobium sp. P12A]TCR91718.1 uncharacterized protein DUF1656 [Rhizobium sp. BK376]